MTSEILTRVGDIIARVLNEGDIDDASRDLLRGLYRALNTSAAELTPVDDDDGRADRPIDAYWQHIGSLYSIYFRMPARAQRSLSEMAESGLFWLDEIDELPDRRLSQFRGIGRVTLVDLRELLDVYFWRAEPTSSHGLWTAILARLERGLDYRYLKVQERERIEQSLAFGQRVIDSHGAPLLANPRAARAEVA